MIGKKGSELTIDVFEEQLDENTIRQLRPLTDGDCVQDTRPVGLINRRRRRRSTGSPFIASVSP